MPVHYRVYVWVDRCSTPIVYDAMSTYQKGDLFCIQEAWGVERVVKFPIANIFRVEEEPLRFNPEESK